MIKGLPRVNLSAIEIQVRQTYNLVDKIAFTFMLIYRANMQLLLKSLNTSVKCSFML